MNDFGAFALSCGLVCFVPMLAIWGLVYLGVLIGRGQVRVPIAIRVQNPFRQSKDGEDVIGYGRGAGSTRSTGR